MPALSEADKERTRYHLGYLGTSFAPSIQLGIPRPVQTLFLVEDAMGLVATPQGIQRIVCLLDTLDSLEAQMVRGARTLGVETAGELTLHPLRSQGKLVTDSLEREYVRWAGRLADTLGVPFYPFAARFQRRGPGTNVPMG